MPPQRAHLAFTRTSRAWRFPPQGTGAADAAGATVVVGEATGVEAVVVGSEAAEVTGVSTRAEVPAGAELSAVEVAGTEVTLEVTGEPAPEPL